MNPYKVEYIMCMGSLIAAGIGAKVAPTRYPVHRVYL